MTWWMIVIIAILVIASFDQLGLWLERRGWLYWRKSKHRGTSSMGNALHQMHSFFEPNIEPPLEQHDEAEDRQWDGERDAAKSKRNA